MAATYRLELRGFKGPDQDIDLEPLNIIEGPTGGGKTSVGFGLQFLALGHVPILGARPEDTAQLMRGDELSALLEIPDDRSATGRRSVKRWIKRTTTGFKTGQECSWLKDKRPADHKRAILELFGTERTEIAEMLDVKELTNLPPQQLAARITDLLGTLDETPDAVAQRVWRHVLMRLTNTQEKSVPKDYREMIDCVGEPQMPHVKKVSPLLQQKIAGGGLVTTITWANEKKRASDQVVAGKKKARIELARKVEAIPESHPEEIGRLEQKRDDIQAAIGAMTEQASAWEQRQQKRTEAEETLADALVLASGCKQQLTGLRDDDLEMERLESEAKTLAASVDAMVAPSPGDFIEVQKLRGQASDMRADAQVERTEILAIEMPELPDLAGAERNRVRLAEQLEEVKADPWQAAMEHIEVMDKKLAGHVGPVKRAIDGLRELAVEYGPEWTVDGLRAEVELEDFDSELEEIRRACQAATAEREVALASKGIMLETAERLEASAKQLDADAEELAKPIQAAHDERVEQFKALRKETIAERDRLGATVAKHAAAILETDRRFQLGRAGVQKAEAELKGLAGGAGAEPDAQAVEDAQGEAAEVRASLETLRAAAGTRDALKAIITELEAAEAEAQVWGALEWGLKQKRAEGVQRVGGGLVDLMAEFIQAAGRTDQPYIFADERRTEMGWTTAEGWTVTNAAMSGGELTIFASALCAALSKLRGAPMSFLIVEGAEPDGPTTEQLLAGIESQDHITISVVMRRSPGDPAIPDGWTHQITGEAVRT